MVLLKEYYTNTIEKEVAEEKQELQQQQEVIIGKNQPQIEGLSIVYPYDEVEYTIKNANGGIWEINNTKAAIVNQTEAAVLVAITTGRSGEFELKYKREGKDDIVLKVTIESL